MTADLDYTSQITGLTSSNQSQVKFVGTYLTPGAVNTSANYGIEGTPNAVFAGLVQNHKKVLNVEIVRTDSMGQIDSDSTVTVSKLSHQDATALSKGSAQLNVHWTPKQALGNDLVTGTLTLSLNGHQVAQQTLTTKANMQFGITGASTTATSHPLGKSKAAAAAQPLKISFTKASLNAMKYIAPVQVNYFEDTKGNHVESTSLKIGQVYQALALNNSTKQKPIAIGVPAIPGAALSQQIAAMRDAAELKEHRVVFNLLYNQIDAVSGFGNFCGMYGNPYAGPYDVDY